MGLGGTVVGMLWEFCGDAVVHLVVLSPVTACRNGLQGCIRAPW